VTQTVTQTARAALGVGEAARCAGRLEHAVASSTMLAVAAIRDGGGRLRATIPATRDTTLLLRCTTCVA